MVGSCSQKDGNADSCALNFLLDHRQRYQVAIEGNNLPMELYEKQKLLSLCLLPICRHGIQADQNFLIQLDFLIACSLECFAIDQPRRCSALQIASNRITNSAIFEFSDDVSGIRTLHPIRQIEMFDSLLRTQ